MNDVVSPADARGVAIRVATAADAPALSEFGARTFFEAFAADNTPEDMRLHLASAWRPELQAAELADPTIETLLACDAAGGFAAFAQLRHGREPPGPALPHPTELWRFYVDRPYQGAGLARRLMQAAEDRARQRGARSLWLGVWERNLRAQAFYRKCGFEVAGSQVFVVGTDPQRDLIMVRGCG